MVANQPPLAHKPATPPGDDRAEREVYRSVEAFLHGRVLSSTATRAVEEVLFDQALLHHLVYAGRDMAGSLRQRGLSVELKYCTSATHGHPIPFLVTRNASGEVVLPKAPPRDAQTKGSTFCVIECSSGAENASRPMYSDPRGATPSDAPITARTKGAIVVIPTRCRVPPG